MKIYRVPFKEVDDITFEEVIVSPDDNIYTEIEETYYMPKVVL